MSNIILREFQEKDIERMHSWVNNKEITKNFVFNSYPRTLDDSKEFLEKQLKRTDNSYVNFVICLKEDLEQKYIGTVGLKNIDYIHRKAELSIVIGFKEYIGKGYGAEAVKLMVKYGVDSLGLNKIYLKFMEFNELARRAYEKCGFKTVCNMEEDVYYNGKFYDQVYMEILHKNIKSCVEEGD